MGSNSWLHLEFSSTKIPSSKISGIYIHFKTSRPIMPSTEKPFKIHCQKGCVGITLSGGSENTQILFDNCKRFWMPIKTWKQIHSKCVHIVIAKCSTLSYRQNYDDVYYEVEDGDDDDGLVRPPLVRNLGLLGPEWTLCLDLLCNIQQLIISCQSYPPSISPTAILCQFWYDKTWNQRVSE